MDKISARVLSSFDMWKRDSLDLHTLFEAGGNDPDARTAVFDAIEQLVLAGLLEEQGNDFYSLTKKGREAAQALSQNELE